MPIYEYECASCGERFERLQRLSDPPPEKCPACGAATVERLLSAPAFQFKGSGWYVTDYARKGTVKPESEGGEKPASKGDKADTKPADSKPTKSASTSEG